MLTRAERVDRPSLSRRMVAGVGSAAVVLAGLGVATAPSASATGLTVATFNYTGATQTWTVPAGVQSVYVQMAGGAGGAGGGNPNAFTNASTATATLTIPTGMTALDVVVGEQGGDGVLGGTGGWPNGGAGGLSSNSGFYSAGGGGSSDIRPSGATFSDALMVVGGSGGGGGTPAAGNTGGIGGAGGLVTASVGQSGDGDDGGAGGAAGNITGGNGGAGENVTSAGDGAGGGGGGGWLGGSGGSAGTAWTVSLMTGGGGGGGGGSGYQNTQYVAGVSEIAAGQGGFASIGYLTVSVSTIPTLAVGTLTSWNYDAGSNATYAVVSGAMPSGLTLDGYSGAVSGVPTQAGSFTFTVASSIYPDGTNAVTTNTTTTVTVNTGGPADLAATSASAIGTTTATANGSVVAGEATVTGLMCAYSTTNPGSGAITGTSAAASPASVDPTPTGAATNVSCPLTGLASNQVYYYQVQGTQLGGLVTSTTATFTTGSAPARPNTGFATNVTAMTATGHGTLSATQSVSAIVCKVATSLRDVATSTTTFTATPATTSGIQSNLPITCTMTGLTPYTPYYYAFFATDASGTSASPTIQSFITRVAPPRIGAIDVGSVGSTSARISGTVTPTDETVTAVFCRFVVSPGNPRFGTAVAATPFQIGPAAVAHAVTCNLSGLAPLTTYLVRMEATDSDGTAGSPNVVTFTTASAGGGGGGGGGGGSTPTPSPTPTPAPTPSPAPTGPSQPASTPTSPTTPTLRPLVDGLFLVTTPVPGTVRTSAPTRPSSTAADATLVRATSGVPTRLAVRGLQPSRWVRASVRPETGGAWHALPRVRTNPRGAVALPPLLGTKTRSFVIRLTQPSADSSYLRLRTTH